MSQDNELIISVMVADPETGDHIYFEANPVENTIHIHADCIDGFTFTPADLSAIGTVLQTGLNL